MLSFILSLVTISLEFLPENHYDELIVNDHTISMICDPLTLIRHYCSCYLSRE